jgi:hypothetical protein
LTGKDNQSVIIEISPKKQKRKMRKKFEHTSNPTKAIINECEQHICVDIGQSSSWVALRKAGYYEFVLW